MTNFRTLEDMDFKGKRVVMRVDFNVPLDTKGKVKDNTRIVKTIPTIQSILNKGAKQIVILAHLGRPQGQVVESLRLDNVAQELAQLMRQSVAKLDVVSHPQVPHDVKLVMLENVRFDPREKQNDRGLAKEFAALGDIFVNDAFSVSHRAQSSVAAIAEFLPACAGLLMEKEVANLSLDNPQKPFMALIGGAKLETKIAVIENLAPKVSKLFLGGAMIFTFYKAQGLNIGDSLYDKDEVRFAKELLKKYPTKLVLPVDIVVADKFENSAHTRIVAINEIEDGWRGLDIGPHSIMMFKRMLREAKTVLWNGPMGVFEFSRFAKGTYEIAKLLASLDATTIAGGGDSVAAINNLGLASKFTHISTAGGAALAMMAGEKLPGVEALKIEPKRKLAKKRAAPKARTKKRKK